MASDLITDEAVDPKKYLTLRHPRMRNAFIAYLELQARASRLNDVVIVIASFSPLSKGNSAIILTLSIFGLNLTTHGVRTSGMECNSPVIISD